MEITLKKGDGQGPMAGTLPDSDAEVPPGLEDVELALDENPEEREKRLQALFAKFDTAKTGKLMGYPDNYALSSY